MGLAGDHRLVDIGGTVDDDAIGRHPSARADEDHVADRECIERDRLGSIGGDAFGRVREEGGQRREGPLRLGDRAHLQPVPEEHDRDEGRQLPPDLDLEEAERAGPAGDEGNDDRQRDEGHHPGLSHSCGSRLQTMTGIVRARVSQNLSRNIATE